MGDVAQDAFFLEAFARAYALGLAHSPDRTALDTFADLLTGVREELRLHASYAARRGIDLSTVEPAPATLAYTDSLLAVAALGVTCAANDALLAALRAPRPVAVHTSQGHLCRVGHHLRRRRVRGPRGDDRAAPRRLRRRHRRGPQGVPTGHAA